MVSNTYCLAYRNATLLTATIVKVIIPAEVLLYNLRIFLQRYSDDSDKTDQSLRCPPEDGLDPWQARDYSHNLV